MSFDLFRTGVPCAKCTERIESFDAEDRARPCGHSIDEILQAAVVFELTVKRPRFGQFAEEGAAS